MKFQASLLPKQFNFVNSSYATNFYCGGVGAGKSVAEIVLAMNYALAYPGIEILVTSPTYRMLKDVIIREAENLIPARLIADFPKGQYPELVFHKRHGRRSKILFRAFRDFGKVKGLTVGAAICDELPIYDEDVYHEILRRLRQSGMPNTFFATGNPEDFDNFVYKQIVAPFENRTEGSEDINYIHTTSFDNFMLPANYIKRLKLLEITDLPRYNSTVLGLWGNFNQNIIGAFPLTKNFTSPYRVAFIDPSFSNSGDSDRTSVAIVGVQPDINKEQFQWSITFTGKSWQKSITDPVVQRELLLFLDKYKPIDTCLESQLSNSSSVFLDSFRQKEKELGLAVKNNWTYYHQPSGKSKHERIMQEVAGNKFRIFALEDTDISYLNPVTKYSKMSEHDDEIDTLAGGISLWYRSEALRNYIRYQMEINEYD